jgi:photosystem II stability/assembly factor-like uncharacterized protein
MRRGKHPAAPARAPGKDRSFFNQHVSFPMRDASPLELERFWAGATRADVEIPPEHHWDCLGPHNIAGRVTALAIHPEKPDHWVAGSAAGGVWSTSDAGVSWNQTWSRFAPQSIGALAWAKCYGVWALIAATGEANMSADTYPGSGLYISLDRGLTWHGMFGAASPETGPQGQPRRVGCIATGMGRSLAFGSVYLDENMPAGLYFADLPAGNGVDFDELNGMRWVVCTDSAWGERSYNCHSVVFHPDRKTVFTAIEPDGTLNGIWRSSDRGRSWEHLTKGLPRGEYFRRISLALAPSDPDVVYALAASRSARVLGVFRSTNGGRSWKEILDGRFPRERHMDYNNTIAVHPRRPDSVIWGGMKLHRTDNAGRNWRTITARERGAKNYVHDDHHVLLWPDDETILSGNDGGVSVSRDGGRTWHERSRRMVTTMFYDLDVAPSNGKIFGGGTQDNGTVIAGVDGLPEGDFVSAIGGDGAWTAFEPADAEIAFASSSDFDIRRHVRGQPWKDLAGWQFISPGPDQLPDGERFQRSFTVLAIDPPTRRGSRYLWAGSARLWSWDTQRFRWRPPSHVFDRSPISAIEISGADPRVMYVGTTKGGIFRSADRGATWSENLAGPDIPARAITSIQSHPSRASTVVVTVASTGMSNSGVRLSTGEYLPYGHVFRSYTGGVTWEDIDAGALPNVAYFSAAYETHPPYRLFVASDVGVWAEIDGDWLHINGNLPNVVVSDLVYHHHDRTLTAATYGRGVWRMRPGPLALRRPRKGVRPGDASALRVDPSIEIPVQLQSPVRARMRGPTQAFDLTVEPVVGAAGYQFEIVGPSPGTRMRQGSVEPTLTLFHTGGTSGKWRVATVRDGLRSRSSPWRRFVARG